MIKLTIKNGKEKHFIPVKNITYFYGWNYPLKYELISALRKHFFKVDVSEYDYEVCGDSYVLINNQQPDLKKWKYYELKNEYSIEEEFKLRTTSLMIQYLESQFADIEYEEIVATINILYQNLSELLTEKINFNDFDISIDVLLPELSLRSILKQIELKTIKEEHTASGCNLTYQELFAFQIKLAKSIAKKNKLKQYIFLVQVPFYDKTIAEELEETVDNAYFIIVNEHDFIETNRENVVYFGKEIIAFADDVEIYNKVMLEYGSITTLEEVDQALKDLLTKKDSKIAKLLKENL